MDIRSLMKQGSKADASSSNLSGKDKAKLLKMMREQQKQREVPVPPKKVPHSVAPVKQASQQSGLPACFFDADPPVIPKSNAAQSAPLAATKVDAPKSTGVSSLPQGFFDNPVEDLSARGITMEQYTAKMEKEEQAELDSFLTEVKQLEGESERVEEEIEQQEGAVREFEEEAAQVAYMANLIALRVQSEQILAAKAATAGSNANSYSSSNSNRATTGESASAGTGLDAEAQQALAQLLREADEVRKAAAVESTVADDVDAILHKKLAQEMASKRKRSAIVGRVLNPTAGRSVPSGVVGCGATGSQRSTEQPGSAKEAGEAASGSEKDGDSESHRDGGSSSGSEGESSEDESPPTGKKAKYTPLSYLDWTARSI